MSKSCAMCGMACGPAEYHPYAACLMFMACHDGDTVRSNLAAVQDDARGIDSGEAGETRSGSTPKGPEPGAREGTRPEEIAQPSLHIEPVMFDNGVPTGWISECPFCLRTLHFERKSPPQPK